MDHSRIPASSPMFQPKGSDTITRAEFFHELRNYVKKDDFDALKLRYERLKRKFKNQGCSEDLDEYSELIKDYGPHCMYDATKVLLHHAYTEGEILSHTVSGKRANSKVTSVKPKFTPTRFSKIKGALTQKYPEARNDPTNVTKKVTAVQKRLKLDKIKRESSDSLT